MVCYVIVDGQVINAWRCVCRREFLITPKQYNLITFPEYSKEAEHSAGLNQSLPIYQLSSYFSTHDYTYKINSDKKRVQNIKKNEYHPIGERWPAQMLHHLENNFKLYHVRC
jgi:hypothetical protein